MAELFVSEDNETLPGTDENDIIEATGFTGTTIEGLAGDDELFAGTDGTLLGGDGNDVLEGTPGGGGNTLNGEAGDDLIVGKNSDTLNGGDGADRLFTSGAGGGNTYTGNAGSDQFWLASSEIPTTDNTVTDFTQGEDVLGIGGLGGVGESFQDVAIEQAEGNTTISVDGGATSLATLEGFTGDLAAEDFVFVTAEQEPGQDAPVVEDTTFEVNEDSAESTEVGTVFVNDAQDDDLTLSLSGNLDPDGDGENAFAIDNEGVVIVNDADDLQAQESFSFALTAEDPDGNTGTGEVTVNIIPTQDGLQADFNDDGIVNLTDLGVFSAAFDTAEADEDFNSEADFNGDGLINLTDLGTFSAEFGTSA
jgi:hypothetical protein